MTDITAEVLAAAAAVQLTIDAPAGIRSLVRRDSNGINDVRTKENVLGVVPPAGELIYVTDYEPGSGPLRYDLTDQNGVLVSLEVLGFALDGPWLFCPVIPGYSKPLVAVTKIGADLENLSTVHGGLLGREDPIVVMRPLGLRSGSMTIWAGSYADALEVLAPLKRATAMMLRQPEHEGLDMYFAPLGASLAHEDQEGSATTWGVQVNYQEIKRPEGPIAGALGWTYADLAAAAPRYQDLPRTFATYADMRLNRRKA
ncbi:minor tail protein [Arthrobacter phage Noely]|uniref:Minor tail protein n=1 Tax=Arthrobacter phage Noely TaxID=2419964 RepID=A0A3G2KAD6_9CAUD|nr:minor tail protein [Arthrobacter phage Noely]AYN55952.1 minor tail protein [Arthrobacter phage Noely]